MKVKHLIRELLKCDPEMPVITEGCDCEGESYRVAIENGGVTICRQHYGDEPNNSNYDNSTDTPRPL